MLVTLLAVTVLFTVFTGAAAAQVDTEGVFNETDFDVSLIIQTLKFKLNNIRGVYVVITN